MHYYKIKRASESVNWSEIESLELAYRYLDTPKNLRAFAQICYNGEGIHLHLWSENDDVRAVERDILGAPYQDSCLEFFFSPMEGDIALIQNRLPDAQPLGRQKGQIILLAEADRAQTGHHVWIEYYALGYRTYADAKLK